MSATFQEYDGSETKDHLQRGKWLPNTAMPPPSEAHVHRNVGSMQHKLVGILKNGGIAVGSAICDRNGHAGRDRFAVELDLLGHGSRKPAIRAEQPNKLLYRGGDQTRIISQPLL